MKTRVSLNTDMELKCKWTSTSVFVINQDKFEWNYKGPLHYKRRHMPSLQTTFRGRLIYFVGQPKQVQLTNAFIKLVDLKFPEVDLWNDLFLVLNQ